SLKAMRGMHESLDASLMATKLADERRVRAFVAADAALSKEAGGAGDAIEKATQASERPPQPDGGVAGGGGGSSPLLEIARTLVRAADELPKPNEQRLEEFGDSHLPALKLELFSTAPIYDELEALTLGMSLTRLREVLGADDDVVKKVLGKDAPKELAA